MKKSVCFLSLIFLFTFISAQKYNLRQIDYLLKESKNDIGGSALILIKDGKVVYKKSFGGMKVDTKIQIASATKWLSAATILTLVDDGLINLDDPVSKYIKGFKNEKGSITIRQLLSHTSGLENTESFFDMKFKTLQKEVNYIAERIRLISTPGTEFNYGGISFQVAGRIAEIVTGRKWEEIFYEKIADPCNMRNTDYGGSENPGIAAGAFSTGNDYANFLKMIKNKGKYKNIRVLSENSVAEMLKNRITGLPILFSMYKLVDKEYEDTQYGLGTWLEMVNPFTDEGVIVSSQGAFGFSPWIDFNLNYIGVFVTKSDLINVHTYYKKIKAVAKSVFRKPVFTE